MPPPQGGGKELGEAQCTNFCVVETKSITVGSLELGRGSKTRLTRGLVFGMLESLDLILLTKISMVSSSATENF